MGIIRLFIITITVLNIFIGVSYASWIGPSELVSGAWGVSDTEFNKRHGDTIDLFPRKIYIFITRIVIWDIANGRFKIYGINGKFEKNVKCIEASDGSWNDECRIEGDFYFARGDGNVLTIDYNSINGTKYFVYSPVGELLKTYTERPPELGKVKEKKLGKGQYEVTVTYPDKEWKILCDDGDCSKYIRDINNNLYCWYDRSVRRYNDAGEEIARLTMPEDNIERIPRGPRVHDRRIFHEEYGEPVIAPNGDVYTWKRTPDTYSIIKWTWQDSP